VVYLDGKARVVTKKRKLKKKGYWKPKEEALDPTVARTHFGRFCGPVATHTAE